MSNKIDGLPFTYNYGVTVTAAAARDLNRTPSSRISYVYPNGIDCTALLPRLTTKKQEAPAGQGISRQRNEDLALRGREAAFDLQFLARFPPERKVEQEQGEPKGNIPATDYMKIERGVGGRERSNGRLPFPPVSARKNHSPIKCLKYIV